MDPLWQTDLALPGKRKGKVRDVYDLPAPPGAGPNAPPRLLIVATDRVSAFDVVLPTPIPGKGRLLTSMSLSWFGLIERRGLCAHHVLSADAGDIPGLDPPQRAALDGRVMITRRCEVVPIECVARGYLDGSGWREYVDTGAVCGIDLPGGLQRGERLPEPIFTPATKAPHGEHDENITFEQAADAVGGGLMETLRERTLAVYAEAHEHALARRIVLADTKFEFGFPVDERGERTHDDPLLIDEVLTPDSSRYWPRESWAPGGEQVSFDKQFIREHLQRLTDAGDWDKKAPGPELPPEVVAGTVDRYEEARRRLFGG